MNARTILSLLLLTGLAVTASARPRPPAPRGPALGGPQPSAPAPSVDPKAQLLITDLSVVEDPVRTNPANGPRATWSFKYLIEQMAGDNDPAAFALRWLELWEQDQIVNGDVSPARPGIRELIIDPWLARSGGSALDLNQAPFKLLAIVNRLDLRAIDDQGNVQSAGEGRFVFGVLGDDGKPLPPSGGFAPGGFLVIFEYEQVADSMQDLGRWVQQWHELGRHRIGSQRYNDALERITRRFSDHGQAPHKVNQSPINQIRTNEVSLGPTWELREFVLDEPSGLLAQHTVAVTPGTVEVNGTAALSQLINDNEAAILDGSFALDDIWLGASSLSGPFQPSDFPDFGERTFVVNDLFAPFVNIPWSAAGINSNDARHAFAVNTCNGCHRDETLTDFAHVQFPEDHTLPGSLGTPAKLSGFLTGIELPDPVEPAVTRSFDDLGRRKADMEELAASFGRDGRGPGPHGPHHPRRVH